MRALSVILALAALTLPAAAATPAEKLSEARDEFRARKYDHVIELITALLYPAPKLAKTRDLVEAYILLGVAQYESGDPKAATREIEAALSLDGTQTLDEQLFSAEARKFFEEAKAAKEARDRAADDARAAAEERERIRKFRESLRFVEKRQFWVNFMPFGAGQFQNGHTKKGIFFAATEAAAAGTSIAIFFYLTNKYGYGGQVPGAEASDVRTLQQVSIGANVVFYGVAIWGVVDAIRNYKPQVVLQGDDSLLPPDLRGDDKDTDKAKDRTKKPPKPTSRLMLHPLPFPDGAGVGLTWEH